MIPVTTSQLVQDDKRDLTGLVTDSDGNGIAGATVLLVHKSWPNKRYQQNFFQTRTDADGKFQFDAQYESKMQNAFLVSVLAPGFEFQSQYEVHEEGKVAGQKDFTLTAADAKNFQLVDSNKKPIGNMDVFVSKRKFNGNEHFNFPQSAEQMVWSTDAEGKVELPFFVAGDKVTLAIRLDGQWKDTEFAVKDVRDDAAPQQVQVEYESMVAEEAGEAEGDERAIMGMVTDSTGNAIAGAKILLVHKSWPGGQFQQNVFNAETDSEGKYIFKDQYSFEIQNAFLVTILADGFEMKSKYEIFKAGKKAKNLKFRLDAVQNTVVQLVDESGDPLADSVVFVTKRKSGKEEFMTYFQSSDSTDWKTGDKGQVTLPYFAAKDVVGLAVMVDGGWAETEFKVEKQGEDAKPQVVSVKKKNNP
jgi:hypothetical protein